MYSVIITIAISILLVIRSLMQFRSVGFEYKFG